MILIFKINNFYNKNSFLFIKLFSEPIETIVQSISSEGTTSLHKPISKNKKINKNNKSDILPSSHLMQAQNFSNFRNLHLSLILLIGKNQQDCILQSLLLQHALQLLLSQLDPLAINTVDHIDEGMGVLEVVFPQLADLVLSSDVPHLELYVLVFNRLHVETDRRRR